MVLEEYKNNSDYSYENLSKHLGMCKTTINKAIRFPWRTKWPTFLKIAEFLKMPESEAFEQWKKSKQKHYNDIYK